MVGSVRGSPRRTTYLTVMPITNKPTDAEDFRDEPWSPVIGLRNAAVRGGIVAAILAVLLIPVSIYLPYMTIPWLLRAPVAIGVAWIMFKVVQDAAGMAGGPCTALALLLTFAVMLSQHLVWAACGVLEITSVEWWSFPAGILHQQIPEQNGRLIGPNWLHWYILVAVNVAPLVVAGCIAAAFWRD